MSPATAGERVGDRDLTTWRTAPGRALARRAVAVAGWARPHGVVLITLGIGLALCALFTLGAAQVYDEVTDVDGVANLDQPVLRAAVGARSPGVVAVVQAYTNLGGPVGMPSADRARRWWTPSLLSRPRSRSRAGTRSTPWRSPASSPTCWFGGRGAP